MAACFYDVSIDMPKTGRNIVRLMERRGMSKRELAERLGFTTVQAIFKWQYGRSLPSLDNLVVLSRLFDCPIEDILVLRERRAG